MAALPFKKKCLLKDLVKFLTTETAIEDRNSLFKTFCDNHPKFNYAVLPWIIGTGSSVKVCVDLAPGKDAKKNQS